LKLVQERAGNTLGAIGLGKDIPRRTQVAQLLKERINKWDYMKLKISAQETKWSLNIRDYSQNGRKYLPATHLSRD
jgi:mitochondrial fission protein ELM1